MGREKVKVTSSNTGKKRVAAYCRVSTEKEDQLMSLQAQKEFFEEYAAKNSFELVALYADEGISGTKLKNRREFNRMMGDAQRGYFECVYVKDVSRLARNVVDFLQSIRMLKSLNIDCRFVTANMSSNDGELTLTILAAVAQEESANLSKRVKFGKKRNAQKGRVPNLVYGYNKAIGEYFNLTINEVEAKVVKRIFNYYVYQGHGANKIAQLLNKEGLLTKRRCRWSQQAISTILTNPLYIGKVINGKESVKDFLTGERVKNHPSEHFIVDKPELTIVDDEVFSKAQALLAERTENFRLTKKRQSNKYCFSTLIQCGDCGYSFRRTYRKYIKEYIRWCCSGRNANGVDFCSNHTIIDEQELLEAIKSYLGSLVSSQDKLLKQTIAEFRKQYKPEEHEISETFILVELARLKKAKSKQTEMFEVDAITIEELKERTAELNASIAKYENELSTIRGSTSVLSQIDELVRKYCGSIQAVLAANIIDNAMLRKVIEKIVVTVEGEVQVYLKLFSDLEMIHAVAI
ncbi:MAG: Resolvase domain protein [Firmicutes bacterium]|nr:Resolvase domain protein [Bacillota bacterium]